MLEIAGLRVRQGGVPVLHGLDMAVGAGAVCGLIGHNGAGKTTTLRAVMGLLPVDSGTIRFDGAAIDRADATLRPRLGIGYMPEDRRLIPSLTVAENILLPMWAVGEAVDPGRLDWVYSVVSELQPIRDRPATLLSGGQQKLVALGRALLIGHRLLLLDEPTEGVAPALVARIFGILSRVKVERGMTILVAESNTRHLHGLLDHVVHVERGRLVKNPQFAEGNV